MSSARPTNSFVPPASAADLTSNSPEPPKIGHNPDTGGKIFAQQDTDNTPPSGYEPDYGVQTCEGLFQRVPASVARGWIDPREMTQWASEATDHTASFQAALTASQRSGLPVSAAGDIAFTILGTLDPAGASTKGLQQAFTRNLSDPTAGGLTLNHAGQGPLFQPSAGGFTLDGLTIFDALQPGTGSVPVPRPPILLATGGVQITDFTITNNAIVNAYDFVRLDPGSILADARIHFNRIFSARYDYNLIGAVPDAIFEDGNNYSPGVNQTTAVFGNNGMLAKWRAKNGGRMMVNNPGYSVDGWKGYNNQVFCAAFSVKVIAGLLNLATFCEENYDAVAQIMSTSGAGGFTGRISGKAYCYTFGDTAVQTDAFSYAGSGAHVVSTDLTCSRTSGAFINAAATLTNSGQYRIVDRSNVVNTGGDASIVNNAATGRLVARGDYDK